MTYRSFGLASLGTALFALSACDVSSTGLGVGAGGAGGTPPSPSRAGGRGGTSPAATGAGGATGTGGSTGGTVVAAPPTAPPPPAPPPAADAAAAEGSFGATGVPGGGARDASGGADAGAGMTDTGGAAQPPPIANPCQPQAELRLCLSFEGAVADLSSERLSLVARQVAFEPGPSGQAARLGAQSSLTISDGLGALTANQMTLEAWVRPERLPAGAERAGIIDRDGHYGLFLLAGGDVGCSVNGAAVIAQAGLRAGEWSSVACTVSGQSMSVWINGTRRAEAAAGARTMGPVSSPISIGSNSPSGENLEGLLDNVRIWTRARAGEEICQTALSCR